MINIKTMENENTAEPLLISQLKSYSETRLKLEKFKAIKKGSPIVANALVIAIAACGLILGCLFGSITLAFYLSSLMGSLTAGFGCVAGLFVVYGILMLSLKKILQKPIVNAIIKKSCN